MSGEQHYTSLQDYLNKSGVLVRGDAEEIAQAKKEYRRYYMRQYKREKRGNKQEIVLSISKYFHKKLYISARRHGVSIPRFLLEIVKAHINNAPVIHHPDKFAELEIEIARLHSELVFIGDKMMQTPYEPDLVQLIEKVESIEKIVISASQCASLKDFLTQFIQENSHNKQQIINILQEFIENEVL